MSKKKEKPVQFLLPFAGGVVNQCYFVSEDELEEKTPADRLPELLEKALAGKLAARTLSRYREDLLREAVRTDSAEALARLMPLKRMEPERFAELFAFAESCRSPDAAAWLLNYRGEHYSRAEFDRLEQRRLDRELGLSEVDAAELRRLFRLRYTPKGVCICGVKTAQRAYDIPAAIGRKPIVGVDAAAFYALTPMPSVRRSFTGSEITAAPKDGTISLGRCLHAKSAAEEPLLWRVLRREEGRALALCEQLVAVLPFHPEQEEVTWESCAIRRWLHTVFLPLSFTEEERSRIIPSRVETRGASQFGTSGGAPTEDRLFLLSAEEAETLLASDASRALGCWWWLRSPGFDNSFAAKVTPDGAVSRIGSFVDADDYGVRPAMWIKDE